MYIYVIAVACLLFSTKVLLFTCMPNVPYVYCKLLTLEKFCSFCGSIGNHKTFPVKYEACGIGSGYGILMYNPESFSVLLHIMKVFHLKKFAMYGISMEQ